jgi:hypothetical protein
MASKVHNMPKYEKVVRYMKNQLFGSFFEKMFWQQTKLIYDTFCSLIRVVGSSLEQKNTHMKQSIPIEIRIAMAFA